MGNQNLPDYITASKAVWTLLKDRDGQTYNENLCFFRALASPYLKRNRKLETKTRQLFDDYLSATG